MLHPCSRNRGCWLRVRWTRYIRHSIQMRFGLLHRYVKDSWLLFRWTRLRNECRLFPQADWQKRCPAEWSLAAGLWLDGWP